MKYLFIIFTFLATFSLNIQAEDKDSFFGDKSSIEIKFGGWSHHDSTELGYMDVPLNESHNGLGIEYYREIKDHENHFLGAGLWYMKDSFDTDSIQASVAYKYRINVNYLIDSIDLNLNVGVVNRTYREMMYLVSSNGSRRFLGYDEYRATKFIAAPMASINVTEHFQVDFTYLPEFVAETFTGQYELFFFRFGYKF